ncbi:uncharacterized protein LOC100165564 isoform X4 [Acyrthosiphon pisum]|uniref:Uncharacterized protein n=1 Tax=Acyrthosiphon pisum TaxID=7029 RepID=A0A8R2D1E4_ACYPI|nr:uncharacterized protein LOC100165564 isoform X4 [Acyrthosiphon pisum]|eukprot:XP_016656177.1 PREDICTED: uncharacterized protein LOC100165564 isoform X2 [Acyrthosiphon pisum]
MLIMLLIPRLLVAVVVMLIVTDVGVIAWRWPSFSWWTKVPRVIVHSPPIYEQNTYGPFKPDSSGIFGFGQKLSDKYNDGPDLSSENSGFGHNPSDKHKNYQELEKLIMSLRKDRQRSTPPTSDNQKDIFSENSGFGPKHSDSYGDKMEDAFLDFLKEKRTPGAARGRLITSAPVNQKLNTTSEQPQDATKSAMVTTDTPLVDELQDPSTNLGKGLGLLILSDPVKWEESSTWNFTKTSSDTQFKTPGATVKHNLQEKELQGTKNLGQQQLPAEN